VAAVSHRHELGKKYRKSVLSTCE